MVDDYFSSKGDGAELREMLASSLESRITAMRKIIWNMTKGSNVDELFPDVLKCAQTDSIKLKKLVYIYLRGTAQREPDLAMLSVNTLIKDLSSHLPLVRALALRTAVGMGVYALVQHLVGPLQDCLRHEDAYVRKTAVMSVAYINHNHPDWVQEVGLVDQLIEMLSDSNVAVVVNVISVLMEIIKWAPTNFTSVNKLLTALNESHEWGQVSILEAVSYFKTTEPWEVSSLVTRVTPYLAHSNAAVVLQAIRVLLPFIDLLPSEEAKVNLMKKLGSPLQTLLSSEPALQYVALKNVHLILQKYPKLINRDVRIFFIKYNDPIYIKLEKLDIMVKVAGLHTIDHVLSELKEYAREADIDLVKKAVRAIGRCAVNLKPAADECVRILLDLIESKVSYTVESAIIAFQQIFRRYPGKYEQALNAFNDNLERIEDSEARAAFIWMLGENAERITDVETLLEDFVGDFTDECAEVQLALLTAVVKLFLLRPSSSLLVQDILKKATELPNPDLRDRAFIYWRLLSTDPAAARAIVLTEKPPIVDEGTELSPSVLDILLKELGSLATVYQKLPHQFEGEKLSHTEAAA